MRFGVHSEFGIELTINIQEIKQMKKQGNASLQVVQERKYSYRTLHD